MGEQLAQRITVKGGHQTGQLSIMGLHPVLFDIFIKNLDAGLEGVLTLQRTENKEELLSPSKAERSCRDIWTN